MFAVEALAVIAGAVATAAFLSGGPAFSLARLVFFVLLYAVVSRVEFEIGSGLAIPTQVVLVPMLFALPIGLVPGAVLAARLAEDPARRVILLEAGGAGLELTASRIFLASSIAMLGTGAALRLTTRAAISPAITPSTTRITAIAKKPQKYANSPTGR